MPPVLTRAKMIALKCGKLLYRVLYEFRGLYNARGRQIIREIFDYTQWIVVTGAVDFFAKKAGSTSLTYLGYVLHVLLTWYIFSYSFEYYDQKPDRLNKTNIIPVLVIPTLVAWFLVYLSISVGYAADLIAKAQS